MDEMHNALNELEKFIHADTEIPTLARAGMIPINSKQSIPS
jgi:hypothetical protein